MGGDYTRCSFNPVKAFSGVQTQQGRVRLDWEGNEFEEILDRRDRAEMYDTVGQAVVPATTPDGFKIAVTAGALTIGIGRAYVDGILAECFGDLSNPAKTVFNDVLGGINGSGPVAYDAQPFFYKPAYPALSAAAGTIDLVYLDVWQREVTVFEDPSLREIALNGPDTATRVQTAWQVKVLQNVPASSCTTPPPAWTALTAPSTARFTAQATPVAPAPGPCVINPAGGYTGIENRAYRIEVHKAGTLSGAVKAQFKWSRDNASLAAKVLSIKAVGATQSLITVGSTGRDAWMRFEKGDNIELIDDFVEWSMRESGTGGPMAEVITVNHTAGEILVNKNLSTFAIVAAQHPRIRRWDIAKPGDPAVRDVNNGVPIPIEEGISVTFGSSATDTLHAGDYIVFAARTADGSIETVVNMPPRGILHHFARLALVTAGTPPTVLTDCRIPWPTPPKPGGTVHEGCCTVVVKPGESIQAAIDSLGPDGGCVCLKVGEHKIAAPIRIKGSHIALHGESTGARVVSSTTRTLVIIEKTFDVEVHDIWFETSGGPPGPDPDLDAVVLVMSSNGIAIYDCIIRVQEKLVVTGVTIVDAIGVRVERNLADGLMVGVRTIADCMAIAVRDNSLSGLAFEFENWGVIGVVMLSLWGACEVTGNTISGFAEGIRLTQAADRGAGSLIADNVVVRGTPMEAGKDPLWGIDVAAGGCTIRGNFVNLFAHPHNGIHATAVRVHITGNTVDSRSLADNVPIGIKLEGIVTSGEFAQNILGSGVISENTLTGPLVGIFAMTCRGVDIEGNHVSTNGTGAPKIGVLLFASAETLVTANIMTDCESGVQSFTGDAQRITENSVSGGVFGIMVQKGSDALIASNSIEGTNSIGILVYGNTETATVRGNHLERCAIRDRGEAAIYGLECAGEIVVELNDVLDTGIRDGKLAAEVDGIRVLKAARSRVQGNHVSYTDPTTLPRNFDCRALRLLGEKPRTILGRGPNSWTLVLDNSFVGVGLLALVEISTEDDVLIERATFSNNYCEHYSEQNDDRRATVMMVANMKVVQGNQIKAEPKFPAFGFANLGSATFTGNISNPIIQAPPILLPAAVASFNIVLP